MNNYRVSFCGKRLKSKPNENEIGKISNNLKETELTYDFLAKRVSKQGCTFSPAIYNGKRKSETYVGQQLFVIDVDDGARYQDIYERTVRYNLPILFAYKTFSWTPENDRFRVVFAMNAFITDSFTAKTITSMFMEIFSECDSQCKDLARMFYGSTNGLYYISDSPCEISIDTLIIAFNEYMYVKYGKSHYSRQIKNFYTKAGVETENKVPVINFDENKIPKMKPSRAKALTSSKVKSESKRRNVKEVDFEELEKMCRLYREFVNGTEYFYYPELFHIATNMINIRGGKKKFMEILLSPPNEEYDAYFVRKWEPVINAIIDMHYKPQGCDKCLYADECCYYKNMIFTANPGFKGIKRIKDEEYVDIKEAEKDLKNHFVSAVKSKEYGIKLIISQTGMGKTSCYLDYLQSCEEKFIIAVPTHALIHEIYEKAKSKGIENICMIPEMPTFSPLLMKKINHLYQVGAGEKVLHKLKEYLEEMDKDDENYMPLAGYLATINDAMSSSGHILMTHSRFIYMNPNSELFKSHKVIIDEDILRTLFCTKVVENSEIEKLLESNKTLSQRTRSRLCSILDEKGYQEYKDTAGFIINDETIEEFRDIEQDVISLLYAKNLVNDEKQITYIDVKQLPCEDVIIMSATANSHIYSWFLSRKVITYNCKKAKYKGRIELYTDCSYSRRAFNGDDEDSKAMVENVKEIIGDDVVITFKCMERAFGTKYHFGGVEGLNCLEGKNISVVGLPNIDEKVYKLYGAMIGVNAENNDMKNRKVQFEGCEFFMNTFGNYQLREIQLWILKSYLEQAVGRARLLRFNCTVKVFARFPVEQFHLM